MADAQATPAPTNVPAATPTPTPAPASAPPDLNAATNALEAAAKGEAPKAADPAKTEAPKADAVPPPAKPAESKAPKSDRFVAALEREKALREQERRAREAVASLEKREAEFKARMAAAGDPAADPIAYLEKLGIPFDKVVSSITSREPPKVEDKVKELETKLETYKREQAEAARRAAEEQARADLEEWQKSVVGYLQKDADKHELINAFAAHEYVPAFISQYAQQYGKILDVDEASRLVSEDLENVVSRVAETKWFKAKYQPIAAKAEAPPPVTPAKAAVSGESKPEARALSSSATATATAVEQAKRALTPAEARERALEILKAHMERAKNA